jgi:hypothetical protein
VARLREAAAHHRARGTAPGPGTYRPGRRRPHRRRADARRRKPASRRRVLRQM